MPNEPVQPDPSNEVQRPPEPGAGAVPLGRRLPRHGVPRRRAVAAVRSRPAREPEANLERLRRLDHRGRAGAEMAQAQLRSGAAQGRFRAGGRDADPRPRRRDHRCRFRHPRRAVARQRQRPRRGRLRRASVQRRDAAGPAGRAALRHQRHQRPVGRAVALHEAVHARLPRRRGEEPDRAAGPGGRRVLGVPAGAVAVRAAARSRRLHRRTPAWICSARRSPRT